MVDYATSGKGVSDDESSILGQRKKVFSVLFSILKSFSDLQYEVRRRRVNLLPRIYVGRGTRISSGVKFQRINGGLIRIGRNCEIYYGSIFLTYGGAIEIGDNSSVNQYCILHGHGGLRIGNGVRIASHTVIIPANHNYRRLNVPIYQQGETCEGITIEDDVWIGSNCTILDGLKIASGCVIGAGAVVSKSTEPFGVYVGVPAKLVKFRNESFDR